MPYKGIVKGNVVLLEEGVSLPEGTHVEVTPLPGAPRGRAAALLEVWASDVPDDAWDAVENAVMELDRRDREFQRTHHRA